MNSLQKLSVLLAVGLFIIWILAGAQLYHNACCASAIGTDQPLSLSDENISLIHSKQNIKFDISGQEPIIPHNIQSTFPNLAQHLKKNSDKILLLTGQYDSKEKNKTTYKNLGLARAAALKKQLLSLGAPSPQIITKGKKNKRLEVAADIVYNALSFNITTIPYHHLHIQDGKYFSHKIKGNLVFPASSFEHQVSLSAPIRNTFRLTAEYLKKSPKRSIRLTGLYKKSETNHSVYTNLGLARANAVKKILTDLGISGTQIITTDQPIEELVFQNDQLTGGIIYSFEATKTTKEGNQQLQNLKTRLQAAPIRLYFPPDANSLQLDMRQRQQFSDINLYLSLVPKASIQIIGHTDAQGSRKYNTNLSTERALFVKNYLINNGLNAKQMSVSSKAFDQPISDNKTEEGRAKNRRVEITLN